jgi:hypothetical protein
MTDNWKRPFALGMVAYVLLVVLGVEVLSHVKPPEWARVVLVAAPPLAAIFAIASQVRWVRRREGLERVVFHEAASLAFFVTVLSALWYGFLQAWAGVPQSFSGFYVYAFGMAAWIVISAVVARRYR